MKRLLSLLLALTLALGTASARAAEAPAVEVIEEGSGLALELTGLEDAYCGIQFTVTLTESAAASFEVDDGLSRSHPSLYSTYADNGGTVTVYIVAKSPLNDGERLRLGILYTDAFISFITVTKLLTLENLEGETFGGEDLPDPPDDPPDDSPDNPPDDPPDDSPDTPPDDPPGDNLGPDTPSPAPDDRKPSGSGQPSNQDQETVSYRVEIPETPENGTLQVSVSLARPGETVTVTAIPAEGFVLDTLAAVAEKGGNVQLTALGDGAYSFIMPESAVTIRASFVAAPQEEDTPVLPFLDVPAGRWYYEAVSYVYNAKLMGGVSADAFAPDGLTTRGQIVTILHRLEGEPLAVEAGGFTDVPAGQWYAAAVDWAAEEGIVNGYGNGRFGPDDNITREQLAAILCRYAKYLGASETGAGDLTVFADCNQVSAWAAEAMAWATGCGLINGKSGNLLDPAGNATRAEVAAILMRFCEKII